MNKIWEERNESQLNPIKIVSNVETILVGDINFDARISAKHENGRT